MRKHPVSTLIHRTGLWHRTDGSPPRRRGMGEGIGL